MDTLPNKILAVFWSRLASLKPVTRYGERHLFVMTCLLLTLFLAVFQHRFFFSGGTWAEAYAEYLPKALAGTWHEVIASSWEGYLTILPSFFTKLYIAGHRPLGLIDFYIRFVTIAFTVSSLAFLAAPIHRTVIRNDAARMGLALVLLCTLSHLSSFSFINIWYIGFVPIIFLCLNPTRMSVRQQIIYVSYAVLVAFTKPSIILAPFVVYRAYKTREYVSNGIILLATFWQTYLLFFATHNGARAVAISITDIASAIYLGSGAGFLKLLAIVPHGWSVLLANLVIIGMFVVLIRCRSFLIAGILAAGFVFSIYSNLLAPGTGGMLHAATIYEAHYKLQREIVTNAFIVLLVFLSSGFIVHCLAALPGRLRYLAAVPVVLLAAGALRIYHPIDTISSTNYIDISSFRQDLNIREPVCMPVAPTPLWSPGTNWYFQYKGGCTFKNFDQTPDLGSFTTSISKPFSFSVDGMKDHSLKSLILLVKNPTNKPSQIILKDKVSGITWVGFVKPGSPDHLRYVAFNVSGFSERPDYEFEVYNLDAPLSIGRFEGTHNITYYAYYMDAHH